MRVGVRLPPCARVDEVGQVAARAEELGFDGCWFPDSQLLWRDVFATMTAAALATERVRLGTAVTNVVTRDPSVLASAINTLAELCPGRFALGLGIGDSSVRTIEAAPASRSTMRERIAALRDLLDGRDNAKGFHLREALGAPPVLVAATGPRNLALAGEIGDGVILLGGADPSALDANLALVDEGARRAGTTVAERDVLLATYCAVTDDVERDARELKPMCMTIAQHGGTAALESLGIEIEMPAEPVPIYPDLVHAEDWDYAVEVCSRWISDEVAVSFAERACVFGDVARVKERLAELGTLGIDEVILHHVGPYVHPTPLLEALGPALEQGPAAGGANAQEA